MNALIIAILAVNLAILGAFLFAFWRITSVYKEFRSFITPGVEGEASPLAKMTDAIAGQFAIALVTSVKNSIAGKASGDARADQAVMGDLAEGLLAEKMPLAGALLSAFPSLKKTVRRNPQLLELALSKLGSISTPTPGNNHVPELESPKFKL